MTTPTDAALREMIVLLLPMAKGYAAKHPVRVNAEIIQEAEALLSRLDAGGVDRDAEKRLIERLPYRKYSKLRDEIRACVFSADSETGTLDVDMAVSDIIKAVDKAPLQDTGARDSGAEVGRDGLRAALKEARNNWRGDLTSEKTFADYAAETLLSRYTIHPRATSGHGGTCE